MNNLVFLLKILMACVCLAAGAPSDPTSGQAGVKEVLNPVPILIEVEESSAPTPTPSCLVAWQNYKDDYKKGYQSSEYEEQRKNIFCDNLRTIRKHNEAYNLGRETYKMGINEFTDLSQDEWNKLYLMRHL